MSTAVAESEATSDLSERVVAAAANARDYLLSLQQPDGWWKGELETNVTMDAEDLLLRQFLGILDESVSAPAARWIRSQQRADGTWANFHGGPADLSTTVEAYVALKLAGDSVDAEHMSLAREFILAKGGIERTRVFTRIWLALFGEWPWSRLPMLPPELIFLPSWAPLNVYDWGCWARQTVVALTVVCAHRPVRDLGFSVDELHTGERPKSSASLLSVSGAFERLDGALHLYEKLPVKPMRGIALRQAGEWIVARQEADGGWGGIQPPWVYSILALHLLGYRLEHPVLRKAVDGLDGFTITENTEQGTVRRLEACQSPVWDTGLALNALLDAGIEPGHPAVTRGARWLLGEEIRVKGDWAIRRPNVQPGGWAFEFANDVYPDTDDTAEIVLALRRIRGAETGELRAAIDRATNWLLGMQSTDGGWGAFDADNTATLPAKVPFADFGALTDPPSADVTAHIVEMLAAEGRVESEAVRRGVTWMIRNQERDGSWYGRWGANHVYGTGAVVPALVAAGRSRRDPAIRKAVSWLAGHQNGDGGWGEDLRSYVDSSWIGRGESTASQTAWALLALHAAGERGPVVRRGLEWLIDNQRQDGGWDEEFFTGTGFPGDFYINYHLYRMVFPTAALGRFAVATGSEAIGAG